jgi:hypothetical protein
MLVIDMEVKRVIRVLRVVWMATQRFFPRNDLAHILNDGLALGEVRERKDPLTMHA